MTEPFVSPPSRENSMVVGPSVSLLHKPIYWLKAYSSVNRIGSPQGVSLNQILLKLNTKENMDIIYKRKTYKHNPKVSPFGIALVKKGK